MYLEFNEPETVESITEWEQELHFTIPAKLKEVLLEKGAFSSGCPIDMEERTFQIYPVEECRSMGNGLVAHIDDLWGGRPEFEEAFSEEEIAYFNENYISFADACVNQNTFLHYYFDRSGEFGWICYDQDDFDTASENYFRPLLAASQAKYSFDEIVSHMASTCILVDEYDAIGELIPGEGWEQALERMKEELGED